ncbi:hypothetical protein C471_10595 [Halorubrum saccharovorum DSM 1137]|uniref:Uncharacterized protein n=1 Tax=Halorubrum saccharovorum DSM 1137 TaxID=1227484 RepID=M0DU98_9EURY|nr:SipW-dependent-type signal peptide-containing protein [Halorubrum saccharovorum]ELZ38403.1 hypothetical protein C471_10595 [Halorubrum saccharovorum DSM 1137]
MNDDTIGLSRRKMLVGLGAVGVASAGAGLGTTAYFNDTESFDDNTLTAGELDLFVHVDYSEDQGSYAQWSTPDGTFIDGNVVGGDQEEGEPLSIEVSDLKPGDSGEGEFCFSIVNNPAYLWMCGALTENNENGQNEPEAAVDTTGGDPGEGMGELADAMQVSVSYCTDDGEGENIVGEEIVSGSLADVMVALRAGVPLYGDGMPDAPIENRVPFEGVDAPFDDDEPVIAEQCVCFEWWLPTSVENEVQTDSVAFDFEFYAEQARHNDGTTNPCVDEEYAADYVNPDGIDQPIPDGVARVGVSYGDDDVVYAVTFDEPAGSQYSLADPSFASTNFSLPFDADNDGTYDFQVAWNAQGNDEFLYSGVETGPNWEKDTSTGWSALPAGITAVKSGSQALISVPRSTLEANDDNYVFGFNAGAGGEQPSVSVPTGGPYSPVNNFTSSQNGQSTTLQ